MRALPGQESEGVNKLWLLAITKPKVVIVAVLVLTLAALFEIGYRGLRFDSSPETLIAKNDQALRRHEQATAIFGSDRIAIVAVNAETASDDATQRPVLTPEFIARLRSLTEQLETLNGVAKVISLTNVSFIRSEANSIVVENLVPPDADADALQSAANEALGNRLFAKNLISPDGKMAAINVVLDSNADAKIAEEIHQIAKRHAGAHEVYIAGEPIMEHHGSSNMARDLSMLTPVSAVLVLCAFYFSLRSWRSVALALLTVGLSVVWALAAMNLAGRPITVSTLTLPVVLMAIGSSYVIHVINQAILSSNQLTGEVDLASWRKTLSDALAFISPPVIVSATTTMAGFAALAFASIPTSRDLGIFAALGVGFAALLSLLFVPAVISLRTRPLSRTPAVSRDYALFLNGLLSRIGALVIARARIIQLIVLLIAIVSAIGIQRIQINTDYLNFTRRDSELRTAAKVLHERLAGAASFQILVDTGRRGALEQPVTLRQISELQRFIESQAGVDSTLSIADLVVEVNRVLTTGTPHRADIPENTERVQDLFAELLSQDDTASHLMSLDRSKAVIFVRSNLFGSQQMKRVLTNIDAWAQTNLKGMKVQPTGTFVLLNQTSDHVAEQQTRSLTIALVLIGAMLMFLFRSEALGVLALIPNLIPILLFFGLLGWVGIDLDINTSLVASVVLGLAVDNAVHFIWRHRAWRRRGADQTEALKQALRQTGKPIIFANGTLVLAFSIFALSTFPPVRIEGLLAAFTILACVLSDLIFLPALILQPRFKLKELP
jgi:hypothetical protein